MWSPSTTGLEASGCMTVCRGFDRRRSCLCHILAPRSPDNRFEGLRMSLVPHSGSLEDEACCQRRVGPATVGMGCGLETRVEGDGCGGGNTSRLCLAGFMKAYRGFGFAFIISGISQNNSA